MEVLLALIAGASLAALAFVLLGRRPAPEPEPEPEVAPVDHTLQALGELRSAVEQLAQSQREQHGRTGELKGMLGNVVQAQAQVAQEQNKLSQALRRPGIRGQWGELTLRNVVEAAGLVSNVDFETQVHLRGEADDAAVRPDMVIRLPGNGQVPVDAKVPLDAFMDAAGASSPEAQEAALDRHVQAVRDKVRELSAKAYWERFKRAPEMVVMFIASEAAFAAAAEREPRLLEGAARARVVIATPATMLALLQVVSLGWREAALSENAERVRGLATELVKRIETMSGHLSKVGRSLEQATQAHNKAVGSYESRLLVTARQLAELGIAGAGELEQPAQANSAPRQLSEPDISAELAAAEAELLPRR